MTAKKPAKKPAAKKAADLYNWTAQLGAAKPKERRAVTNVATVATKKPAGVAREKERVHRPYRPPVPADRLDAMISAVHSYLLRRTAIDPALAHEMYWALVRVRYGQPKKPKAVPENLRAAALARTMIEIFGCPVDQAIEAAFSNPNGADPESLRRNYFRLCEHLVAGDGDTEAAWSLYERTEHYERRFGQE